METNPIKKAIEFAGGQAALAKAIGVHPSMVSQWLNGHRPVSALRAIPIEKATKGAVSRHDLCPAVFGKARKKRSNKAA